MADDGWNGLDLLWEAALSHESADADLSDVVSSETTSGTLALTLLSSPGQFSMTLPGNQPKGSGTSSRPSVTREHPAQVHDAPSVFPTSASSSAALVYRERSTGKNYTVPNHGLRTQVDSDVRDSEAEKTVEERMDSDTTAPRPKLTREEGTYERLLAVDDTNPYQYPPGKECILAWKVALRHSLRNTYQPTEPQLMLETEKEIKAQKNKDVDALHSLRVLVDRKVKEFKEKHQKRQRESGSELDPVNIVDQVIQSLAEQKDNQPSAVPKAYQRSPGAIRDDSLIRGMSTSNKATAPLYSVGDKDTQMEPKNTLRMSEQIWWKIDLNPSEERLSSYRKPQRPAKQPKKLR